MTASIKTVRCPLCGAEFTDAEITNAKACPACGCKSAPSTIANDVTIKTNWHELRILGIWADNWAQEKGLKEGRMVLAAILNRIRRQYPDAPPLSMAGEFAELEKAGFQLEATDAAGKTIHKTKKPGDA